MVLIAVVCPKCGGTVHMDDNLKRGFCTYCGSEIINESAVPKKIVIDDSESLRKNISNQLALAELAFENGDFKESYDRVSAVIETDIHNEQAWALKSMSFFGKRYFNQDDIEKDLESGMKMSGDKRKFASLTRKYFGEIEGQLKEWNTRHESNRVDIAGISKLLDAQSVFLDMEKFDSRDAFIDDLNKQIDGLISQFQYVGDHFSTTDEATENNLAIIKKIARCYGCMILAVDATTSCSPNTVIGQISKTWHKISSDSDDVPVYFAPLAGLTEISEQAVRLRKDLYHERNWRYWDAHQERKKEIEDEIRSLTRKRDSLGLLQRKARSDIDVKVSNLRKELRFPY